MPLLAPLGDLVVLTVRLPCWRSSLVMASATSLPDLSFVNGDARCVPGGLPYWLKVGATLLGLLFIMSSVVGSALS